MKKLCRILLAGAMMALLWLLPSSPFDHAAVHAAVFEGGFADTDTVFWKVDTDAGVLTIYGSGEVPYQTGEIPYKVLPNGEISSFTRIVIEDGITSIPVYLLEMPNDTTLVLGKDVRDIPLPALRAAFAVEVDAENPYYKMYDGCLYTGDYSTLLCCSPGLDSVELHPDLQQIDSGSLLHGIREIRLSPDSKYLSLYDGCLYTKDFRKLLFCPTGRESVVLHPDMQQVDTTSILHGVRELQLSPDNKYLALYDECLYTKDYRELLFCPAGKTSFSFHPNLQIIGRDAFNATTGIRTLVIPWGVTTLRPSALASVGVDSSGVKVILPDTLTTVERDYRVDGLILYRETIPLYSSNNQTLSALRGQPTAEAEAEWSSYYPEHTQPVQTPESSAPAPSEPSDAQPASAPAESASPSQPPAQPESSESAQSAPPVSAPASSQAEQPASSTPPAESSAASAAPSDEPSVPDSSVPDSSVPDSSVPDSSVPEGAEESASSSAPESSDEVSRVEAPEAEETGGSFSWLLPVAVALCAAAVVAGVMLIRILKK